MTFKRFLSLSILAATCAFGFGEAQAQSLSRDRGPAEIPPASFTANQYVDSKGCVYIRAGVDGNTQWVPRVARSRKILCGMAPSLPKGSGTTVAQAPAPSAPVQIGVNSVAAGASATVPKSPATRVVRPAPKSVATALAPKPVRTVASKKAIPAPRPKAKAPVVQRVNIPQPTGVSAPMQRRVAQPQIVRKPVPQQRIVRVQPQTQQPRIATAKSATATRCANATGISRQYIGRNGLPVRCGPQAEAPVFYSRSGQVLNAADISPNARIVPKHVYELQQAARIAQPVPKGYRQVWSDDRLNPNRAHMTVAGKQATDLIWSREVPRRLIARDTGRDVTRAFPGLRYPYTSMAQQQQALVQQQVVVSSKNQAAATVRRVQRQPARVSTQSPAPSKPAAAAGKRFVQVGTYGVPSNAQRAAQQVQRMGLPVRIGKFTRGGKQMRIVLAGPFKSGAHTGGAVSALRRAGYRDAFARN